jgi:hypothetical protein
MAVASLQTLRGPVEIVQPSTAGIHHPGRVMPRDRYVSQAQEVIDQ